MKTLYEGKRLYAVIIIFVFIIIFLITYFVIRQHYNLVLNNTIKENKSTANLLSSLIYEHQKAASSIMESYAQRPLFINAVKKKNFDQVIPHLQSLREHYSEIDAPFLTDQYGTLWANYPVDSTGFGKNLAHRDWYKGVSREWKPYISSIYRLIVLEKGLAVAVSVPVFDGNGKVIGILGGAQRIAFMAAFIKANMKDTEKGITLLDQQGNIIFSTVVPYAEKITKYPVAKGMEKALAGVTADMEIKDAKKKGSISYVSITPVRGLGWSVIVGQEKDAILKSLFGYFILTAVTGLVIFLFLSVDLLYFRRQYIYRKTKEFLASEEKYRNLFDNAVEAVYQSTPEGRLISVNKAFAGMFGYESPEEAINLVTDAARQMYANPDDRKRVVGIYRETGHIKNFECRMRRKDGSIFWARNDGRFTKTADGTLCFEGFIIDITDRKEAEKEIEKLNTELEQRIIERTNQLEAANKELEAFSYSVSHDLRAPLRAIDGFSSIIMKEYREKLDAEGIRLLNVIGTNAKHMDQLITDLLALSRVSKSELKSSRIDMTTLAQSIYDEIATPEVQQKFAFSVAPLPDSNGDPALLRQVWSNLLSNAIKFTLPRDERRIEISGHTEEGINIYSIRDTGVGFNPNYTHKLFGVFQRLHKSSEFEGNGVGLAIVQRIIHRHGGRVWAEGTINEGAAFFFSLPIKEAKDEPHE